MEQIITYAGPLTFLGLQCSTFYTGYTIYKNQMVYNYSIVPFFTLFINCTIWGIYGYLIDAAPIYGPNVSGAFVGFFCTYIYQKYSPTRDRVMYLVGATIILVSAVAAYFNQPHIVGGIGSFLSVAVMGAPLSVVTTVISERSTDAMPFPTSLLLWISSLSWTLYGYLYLSDPLVYIPNFLGLLLASLQMVLFCIYGLPYGKRGGGSGYSLPI